MRLFGKPKCCLGIIGKGFMVVQCPVMGDISALLPGFPMKSRHPPKTLLTGQDEVCLAWEGRVLLLSWCPDLWGCKRRHHPAGVHRACQYGHAGSQVPILLFLLNRLHPALHKTFRDAKSVLLLQGCENRIFMAFYWK